MNPSFRTALVLAICFSARLSRAQSTPDGRDSAAATTPTTTEDAAASPPVPEASPTPATPAPSQAAPAPTGETPDASTAASDDADSEITISVPRPDDMQKMSEASLKDVQLGGTRGRYSLNFFADTAFTMTSANHEKVRPSFGIGDLDTLITAELENSIRLVAEFALEVGDDNHTGVDLERLHLRWSKWGFFLEAGRWHTDLGYWNQAYHHGHWLQPTQFRPRLVRFEDDGGILPVHWVGVQAGYSAKLGGGAELRTSFAVGNARGAIIDNVQAGHDEHRPKALHAKLELAGVGLRDLHVGLSGVYGSIAGQPATIRPALPNVDIDERIGNAYIAYTGYPLQVISEGYLISHKAQALMTSTTLGAFLVVAYSFAPVTPYIRVERLHHTGDPDAFFVPDPKTSTLELDVNEGLVGVRIDTSTWSAVKAEYSFTRNFEQGFDTHTGLVSWACGI